MTDMDLPATVLPAKNEEWLAPREVIDYEHYRAEFIEWLSVFGKNPEKANGYADDTVKNTAGRCALFDRFVWEEEGGYMLPTHDHADAYMKELARGDYTGSHRCNTRDSVARYFKWRHHEYGEPSWESGISFSKNTGRNPQDYLTIEERTKIRQAVLEYGSIPGYSGLTPEERKEWKQHISQYLRKPLSRVTREDWKQVNGWKYASMTWVSLDAGLRPKEVGRAKVQWVDLENRVLRIPVGDSTKNKDNWIVSLSYRTADALERWLVEREHRERYENTDALWLTREGNPYGSNSLRRLLLRLCEIAEIPTENRKMSWYAIRHSVGTYMTREEDLAAAKEQLRHRSSQTTMRYDHVPVEDRRDALDRMG